MGFFKKKKDNITEADITPVGNDDVISENEDIDDFDDFDDFDEVSEPLNVTREEFHRMAEENMREAIEAGITQNSAEIDTVSADSTEDASQNGEATDEEYTSAGDEDVQMNESVESKDEIKSEIDDEDDFGVFPMQSEDIEPPSDTVSTETESKPKKEKKPRMTFAEFRAKYHKSIKIIIISLGVIFALCLCIYIYGCVTIPKGVMGRNVYIEDVNVSGLTYEEALEKVKNTSLLDNCDITVMCKGHTYTINGLDVGLSARVEDTVNKAMRYGKTGNVFIDGLANTLQIVSRKTVLPSANVNEGILRSKLTEFGNIVYGELVEHKLEVGDEKIICTPGHTGFSGNTDMAYEQVLAAIEAENFSKIRVSLEPAPPKALTLEDIDAFTYANPQDARYEVVDNQISVVPEVWGRYLDLDAVRPLVSQIYEGGSVVNIPFNTSAPTVTAATLNEKLFNATLGSYSTNYGGSTANRAANVANAASKINGKILMPGDVFSFNDTVGKRSVANGFYEAPEYADGQTVMGIGGGTCQVSSTLYNAVLYADLSIVARLNHMFTVGYCEAGQDATVSDSGVDFKFANNTDYPIKISAVPNGGRITISIIGTERDVPHKVKIENYSTYSNDNRTVRSYRMVYDPEGNLIRKDDLGKSYYMAHQ